MKNISDDKLKAYFLGRLPEPEAESLEMDCALDEEIFERSQIVERELADDYLGGNLSAADRRLFETNYLISETRQQKLQLAAQFRKIVRAPQVQPVFPVASVSPLSFWQRLFNRRHAFRFAFGSLFLLLAFGTVAFYLVTSSINKSEVAEVKDPIQSAKPVTPAVESPDKPPVQDLTPEDQPPKPVSPDRNIQNKESEKDSTHSLKNQPETRAVSAPRTNDPVRATVLMTVKLLPGSLRDDGEQSITIAPNVKNIHFLLNPAGEPNNYKSYRVTIKAPETGTIFTSSDLKALSFKLGAEKLESRTYIISLEGKNTKNEFESIADYTLRVRR